MDLIRSAVSIGDWPEAWRLSMRLNVRLATLQAGSGQISPGLELAHLEMVAGKDATTRMPQLPRLAKAAYSAGQYKKAEGYAKEALEAAAHGDFPWTGDAIHQGNIVLGRLALRNRDTQGAIRYLLAAGKAPSSLTLEAFGPNMSLAKELLSMGQTAPVIQYLEECTSFWSTGSRKLAEWLALLRAGLIPDFGQTFDY